MTGQNAIIDLRLSGYVPDACWVLLLAAPRLYRRDWDHPENAMRNEDFPEVHILPEENVNALDFRFLRAMVVHIIDCGGNAKRTLQTLERIVQFEPKTAVACVDDHPELDPAAYALLIIHEQGMPRRECDIDKRFAKL